jgi:hypothetical protein
MYKEDVNMHVCVHACEWGNERANMRTWMHTIPAALQADAAAAFELDF